jgi:hypothetical protein
MVVRLIQIAKDDLPVVSPARKLSVRQVIHHRQSPWLVRVTLPRHAKHLPRR